MEHEVRVRYLFERGGEGRNELVRKVPHKADGVRDGELATVWRLRTAHGGVEGREQRVLHEHARPGDAVEERRLARVGVADDRHVGHREPLVAAHLARGSHLFDLAAEHGHARADAATV